MKQNQRTQFATQDRKIYSMWKTSLDLAKYTLSRMFWTKSIFQHYQKTAKLCALLQDTLSCTDRGQV